MPGKSQFILRQYINILVKTDLRISLCFNPGSIRIFADRLTRSPDGRSGSEWPVMNPAIRITTRARRAPSRRLAQHGDVAVDGDGQGLVCANPSRLWLDRCRSR